MWSNFNCIVKSSVPELVILKNLVTSDGSRDLGSQGGQVDCSPDFNPGGLGSSPALGNQQKKDKKRS